MIRFLVSRLIRAIPSNLQRRMGFKLLRSSAGEMRAFMQLFMPPYNGEVDWKSGTGDAIYVLYSLVRALKPQVVVETGSARGRSTCALALGCKQNNQGKVYAIDPHNLNPWTEDGTHGYTLPFLLDRLRDYELESWCEVIQDKSASVAKRWCKPIDLLFIDGDHSYEGVCDDFYAFHPFLSANAIVIFHDTAWEYYKDDPWYRSDLGVPRFMQKLQKQGYHSITLLLSPGLTLLQAKVGGFDFMRELIVTALSNCT